MRKLFFGSFLAIVFIQLSVAQNFDTTLKGYLQENYKIHELEREDISDFTISSQSYSKSLKAYNVYADQNYRGIRIFNSSSSFVIKDNRVRSAALSFISNISNKVNTASPAYPAVSAISKAVAKLGIDTPSDLRLIETQGEHTYLFNEGNISLENIPVELVYHPINDGEKLLLAWDLSIYLKDASHYYSVRLDAQTGEIISLNDLVISCSFDDDAHTHIPSESILISDFSNSTATMAPSNSPQYRVFPIPLIGPSEGADEIVSDPSDPEASLYGWHDTDGVPGHEYTYTRGNNVYAYEDIGNTNTPGEHADGGDSMNFDFPYDLPQDPYNFTEAAITNLFYMNNIMHDVFYRYGFDEASGNFQFNNYGRGGTANDHVLAEAQDGRGMNNANFAVGQDGVNPRMQMYLWTARAAVVSSYLVINNSSLAGTYYGQRADFGPALSIPGVTANLAVVQNSGSEDPHDACGPITNAADLNGKIALIRRGDCPFIDKVQAAQDAGAVGVIMVNNETEDPSRMGGEDTGITIPSIIVYKRDGENLIEAVSSGTTISATIQDDGSNGQNYRKDGDLDNTIIAHEYGHGISIRLTGGRFRATCLLNEEQMGEGWSDYFGLVLTMKEGDRREDPRGLGTYALGQGRYGEGLRTYRYSTDMSINPFTYNNIKTQQAPHGVGSVWATMLWDMTWDFIDEYGFDPDIYEGTGGNNMALQLVMDGLKLQPCGPGFVDGRDAILEADQIANNGENKCLIWNSFARRGLGLSANQGSADSKSDGSQAFDVPEDCPLGVGDFNGIKNKFVVYPNPSHGEIHIQSRFDISNAEVSIYDMNGRKIMTHQIDLHGDSTINTSSLFPGLYMVNIQGGGFSQTTKLIVE